ncbi:PREDICTED: CTL-like protein DDB_G0288717 [Nelumbo nucifera]|uniref:Choline transporter-like protein n=1 Tax=Nelumbo nucifera TaxID=4432 RepID=A0A1U7Z1D4_NELNU|nr:PREDICTED: CTL-like protein DDB_G0288717 [Nelumbo nucifera]
MASTDDEPNKPSAIYDSSPSEPLLSKPYPSPSIEENQNDLIESEQNNYPQITFNYGPRHFQDLPFMFLFILFVLSTFAFGIFSVAHRNPNSSNVSSFVYDSNTSSCVKESLTSPHPEFYQILTFPSFSNYASSSHLWRDLTWTLVITFVLSVPFVLGLLWLLRHYAKQIVYVSLPFFVVIPIFFNVFWFVACTVSSSCSGAFPLAYRILVLVFIFLIIAIIVWIIVANWHRIGLTVDIIEVASYALARNLGLFGVLPCLTLGLLAYFVPIVVFLVFALHNGKIEPHVSKGSTEGYSCVWKQDSWVPAYYTLAIVTMLWSAAVMVEAQVYVISGTIAQWYFSKDDSTRKRSIRSSLRNAFGPSFGTVCFSGLIIAAVRVVRASVDSARREDAPTGIMNLMLRCCVNALLSAVDFVNKFTINFVAITGEGYCSGAKMTYELLKRNLLSPVFVETVSTRILGGIIFVLSAVYAIVVCAILKAASNLGVDSYLVAVLAWVLLIVVLGFFVHVLENVIDTVYVCYAIDRDRGEVFKQDVHEVYVHLPISRDSRPSLATRTPFV